MSGPDLLEAHQPRAISFHVPYSAPGRLENLATAEKHGHARAGGPFAKQVEKYLATLTGARQVALTTSCTAAMEVAALALGLKPGDEVIVPTFTFCASASAFERTGAKIVFCDIDPETLMMDPTDLERRITSKTRAIVVVHYGGALANMERICLLAETRGIDVVEDAAQAVGVSRHGRAAGTFGTFGAYSFHETKVVSCGQGGALLVNTKAPAILQRLEAVLERGTDFVEMRRSGKDFYEWVAPGSAFRMGEYEAAVLSAEFAGREKNLALRRKIADVLLAELEGEMPGLRLLQSDHGTISNHHFLGLICESEPLADFLLQGMAAKSIDCRRHYAPLHLSPRAATMGYGPSHLPNVEACWRRLIRLPIHTGMSQADAIRVARTLRSLCLTHALMAA